MSDSAHQWSSGIVTDDEKHMVKRCLGFFASTESLVANNLEKAMDFIVDPECRQYMARQIWEESLHNWTMVHICESIPELDEDEMYGAYINIPSVKAKDDFLMKITQDISRQDFDPTTPEGKIAVLKNFLTYWIICEGIFFYSGFAMLLSLGRQNKLQGIVDQIKYTLRDESNHIAFGVYVINQIIEQNPELWTDQLQQEFTEYIKEAVQLEITYAQDVLPNGILGLNSDMFVDYMHYIGNRRLELVGLDYRFPSDTNPFSWLSEQVDVKPIGNFFERRVREYRNRAALDNDW